jgi:predicted phosphohydrolase
MGFQDQLQPDTINLCHPGASLKVNVICTNLHETLAALRTAGRLACNLHAEIDLLVPQLVPYPLELHHPPIAKDFTARRFQTLADGQKVPTSVQVILCRERESAWKQALNPHSLVVIGHRKHWWKPGESRLARALRKQGHEVISVAA